MNLRKLAEEAYDSFGLQHTIKLRALRQYLQTTIESQLINEILTIPSAVLLRTIWEAGVSGRLQEAYFKRLGELS